MMSTGSELDRIESLHLYALSVLKRHEAVVNCPECGEHEVNNFYKEGVHAAYAQVTAEHKRGEIKGTLQEIRDAVRYVLSNSNIDCPHCARAHGD